jgi:hypothetical protein
MEQLHDRTEYLAQAERLIQTGSTLGDMGVEALADLVETLHREKIEKDEWTDSKIDYNDEIVSIEFEGELETCDITVSGDNLFYCNGILTKNSMGLAHTADLLFALYSNDELKANNQLLIKQLKNRYNDLEPSKFLIGIDRSRMRLFNLENSQASNGAQAAPSGAQAIVSVGETPFSSASRPSFNDLKV